MRSMHRRRQPTWAPSELRDSHPRYRTLHRMSAVDGDTGQSLHLSCPVTDRLLVQNEMGVALVASGYVDLV